MKLKLLLSIFAFAVLIGGASVIYGRLSKDSGGSNLQILGAGEVPSASVGGESAAASVNPSAQSIPTQTPPAQTPVQPIVPSVPDFTVYDANGAAVKLSDYFGKPVVLNFFASWCGPCRSEMPAFQAQYEALHSEIAFVFVSVDSTYADAKRFVEGKGYTFPILHDATGSASAAYAVRSIPATFFIDRNGTLAAQAVGALSRADLQNGIDQIK